MTDEILLRNLLAEALKSLDLIADEPNDGNHNGNATRALAKATAKHIRDSNAPPLNSLRGSEAD